MFYMNNWKPTFCPTLYYSPSFLMNTNLDTDKLLGNFGNKFLNDSRKCHNSSVPGTQFYLVNSKTDTDSSFMLLLK